MSHEIAQFKRIIDEYGDHIEVYHYGEVVTSGEKYDLQAVAMGSKDTKAPTFLLIAGVHGLEKIGSEVVMAYLETCLERCQWDWSFNELLKRTRLVFIPIVNPYGVAKGTRANAQGVDLMRNSPLDAVPPGGPFYRGHRISPRLPYFRGVLGMPMEVELTCLMNFLDREVFTRPNCLAVDVHSGFGVQDRLWFPFAHSHKLFPQVAEVMILRQQFEKTYPNHVYVIEPMSQQYTIHGDLWDYLYLRHREAYPQSCFLPWTLEMGSWAWLKKNPLQIFSRYHVFHPIQPHRRRRILRRHLGLFDFFHRSLASHDVWLKQAHFQQSELVNDATRTWYE